jgi:hypothetical protein
MRDYESIFKPVDKATLDMLVATAADDKNVREAAQWDFAKAIEGPLRQGVLVGDTKNGVMTPIPWSETMPVEFPLDLLAPGEEDEFTAYTSPGVGYIAEKRVAGDYVTMATYEINNAIDWELRFARNATWNIVQRALQVLEAGFIKKMNDDAWHTILSAGVDRNILVYDGDAATGQLTKRLFTLAKVVMQRNAGGNSASLKRGILTDLFLSPEGMADIRNWSLYEVDEFTRREIYIASDDADVLTRVMGVNLHDMTEFGVGHEYQNFFVNQLGGTIPSSDVEIGVGLDLRNLDSFVMPVTQQVTVFPDDNMHRRGLEGYYARARQGFGVLDGRRTLIISY